MVNLKDWIAKLFEKPEPIRRDPVISISLHSEPSWKKHAGHGPSGDYLSRAANARRALSDTDYLEIISSLGLAHPTQASIDFLKAGLLGVDWPKGITLRRHGSQIPKEELKALGYRANLVLSRECWAILSDKGRGDPVESTQFIVSAIESRVAFHRRMGSVSAAMGDDAMVQVIPNNTASGSCAACVALASEPIPLAQAPSGPLPSCPHPDQCVLHWRTIYRPD
ncbi:hypothetical protein [Sphingobium yanoikuyae]|uniref:hypothetical protein n=1 Tax=Sphingobium yanoikuyae TaxID=13690 RepID=UPI000A52326A|nr:hypothetical protein [Sphingobium yanoikuyae]